MFANGFVARELIVDVDDSARRLAYSARSPALEHHHASFQVFDDGPERERVVWITDLLPADRAGMVRDMMEAGAAVIQSRLSASGAAPASAERDRLGARLTAYCDSAAAS